MSFIPQNPVGGTVVSQGSALFEIGVSIGTDFGYDTEYISDFLNVEGLPNLVLSAQGSADGNAPEYPDANVGSLRVTLESAYGNSGVFEAGLSPTIQTVKEYVVAQTNTQTYTSPPLYERVFVPAALVRFKVNFLPQDVVAGNFGKLYIRIVASA